ncbi:hypothetical protein [Micromonospora humida]
MGDRDTAFAAYFAARSEAMRGTPYLLVPLQALAAVPPACAGGLVLMLRY